ncbi:MAG: hypothetical protein NDJ94_02830 [Vicinamibacteria bacterium]|jgi:hypothetical protein|nr:hypothetical protein [Vicinamibacteria bacterium]
MIEWGADQVLDEAVAAVAFDGPGLIVLLDDHEGVAVDVWAEASDNVRNRLLDMLRRTQAALPQLEWLLRSRPLRFRVAAIRDPLMRFDALQDLLGRRALIQPIERRG